jgi:hypothetical protein
MYNYYDTFLFRDWQGFLLSEDKYTLCFLDAGAADIIPKIMQEKKYY